MNARNSYTARQTDRMFPANDSIMPKGVVKNFMRHAALIGVTGVATLAAIVLSVMVIFGAASAAWLWLWALVGVLWIAQIVTFLLFVRAGMREL